jgi:hypothetical protein
MPPPFPHLVLAHLIQLHILSFFITESIPKLQTNEIFYFKTIKLVRFVIKSRFVSLTKWHEINQC